MNKSVTIAALAILALGRQRAAHAAPSCDRPCNEQSVKAKESEASGCLGQRRSAPVKANMTGDLAHASKDPLATPGN